MSRAFRALKITAVPLLFAAAALGLATVHLSAERKAARVKMHAAHAAQTQDANLSDRLAGIKLKDLAPGGPEGRRFGRSGDGAAAGPGRGRKEG